MTAHDKPHAGTVAGASPFRRWLALLSLLLLVVVPQAHSVLQHGNALHTVAVSAPSASASVSGKDDSRWDADDSLCMLCSVLGSATKSPSYHSPRPVDGTHKLASIPENPLVPERWHFEQLSRPPPANDAVAVAG